MQVFPPTLPFCFLVEVQFIKNFIVLVFTFRSVIHFELFFCVWCKEGIQLHTLACGYLVISTTFVKKPLSPYRNYLDITVEGQLTINMRVYYAIPLICMLVGMPVPHCLGCYSFVVSFQMRKYTYVYLPTLFFYLFLLFWVPCIST